MSKQLPFMVLFALTASASPTAAQPTQLPITGPAIVITHKLVPSPDLLVRTVHIGDLDLKSALGQKEMEKRVALAVDSICAIPSPLPSYKGRMEKPCRDEAWASARPQMADAIKRATSS